MPKTKMVNIKRYQRANSTKWVLDMAKIERYSRQVLSMMVSGRMAWLKSTSNNLEPSRFKKEKMNKKLFSIEM